MKSNVIEKIERKTGQVSSVDLQIRDLLTKSVDKLDKIPAVLTENRESESQDYQKLIDLHTELQKSIESLTDQDKSISNDQIDAINKIVEAVNKIDVTVPDTVKVENLSEIKIPEKVSLNPAKWLIQPLKGMADGLIAISKQITDKVYIQNRKPSEAIPVQLVNTRNQLYDAKFEGVFNSPAHADIASYQDDDGKDARGRVDYNNLVYTRQENYRVKSAQSGDYIYVGYALPDTITTAAGWRIKRVDTTTPGSDIEWADGDDLFDNIWTNYASLTYGPEDSAGAGADFAFMDDVTFEFMDGTNYNFM